MTVEKLSIITINFNNAEGLHKTIESVVAQSYKKYEYIIIDGGSTDNSINIIKQIESKVNYWISEKDKGIYNAQNKGIDRSTGEYLLFLNSGDTLVNNQILEDIIDNLDGTDIIYGDLIIEPSDGKNWVKKYSSPITFSYFFTDTLPHQGSFIRRNILQKTGGYFDESLQICADWKFFIDAICKHNATIKYLNKPVANYNYTGISSLPENGKLILKEKAIVLERDYPRFYFEINELNQVKGEYFQLINSKFFKASKKIHKFTKLLPAFGH